jgi:2-methylisocitrate lyase-like PEP mutase family enzyme
VNGDSDLKARLQHPEILVAPGVYDAFTALMAAQAGAEAVYLSGGSIAYTRLGLPDIGLATLTELADTLAAIADRIAIPIIADADSGFGNALNVQRTVRLLERNGASAIQIEDQASPKRCGHLAGKTLIPAGEMAGKLHAALDARRSERTLVMARTDAIAVEGFEAAMQRASRYADAGADILFIEAPESAGQMKKIGATLGARLPILANMVEGGASPFMSAAELQKLGFRIAIFPGGTVRAVGSTLRRYFSRLLADGTTRALWPEMLDLNGINETLGTGEFLRHGQRYDRDAMDRS